MAKVGLAGKSSPRLRRCSGNHCAVFIFIDGCAFWKREPGVDYE